MLYAVELPSLPRRVWWGEDYSHPRKGGKQPGFLRLPVHSPEHLVCKIYLLGEGIQYPGFPGLGEPFPPQSGEGERNLIPKGQKRSRKGELALDLERGTWMEFLIPVLCSTRLARYLETPLKTW